ncbi:MAG: ATP-dependent DNA helicase RecG [Proteobacteria bacterium]|nr:ATP-dependent DNA helicase RecG [Pseudomonadota bacterium]
MRPHSLSPLFAPITTLPTVGKGTALFLGQLDMRRVGDLLWHKPCGTLTRRYMPHLKLAVHDQVVTVMVHVTGTQVTGVRAARRMRVACVDEVGTPLTLVYFHGADAALERITQLGSDILVSGRLEQFRGAYQMVHPDFVGHKSALEAWVGEEPLYPLTKGITHRRMAGLVQKALERTPDLDEWIPESIMKRYGWDTWRVSIGRLHAPRSQDDLSPQSKTHMRLAFDEFFASQLALMLMRQGVSKKQGRAFCADKAAALRARFLESTPFSLTTDQEGALREIDCDMTAPTPMVRLLQGDVGTGKTLVAFMALLGALADGAQGALMAPTEVLAKQHARTLLPWLEALGLRGACLTGSLTSKEKKRIQEEVAAGDVHLLIGTHALIQDGVSFKDLGLVVIDEQHRFGVEQRLKLVEKGRAPDVLTMTATPIPRTLMLTSFGDLPTSILREKPHRGATVDTRLVALARLEEVTARLAPAMAQGHKIYWICPLIEESDSLEIAAATKRFEQLQELVPPEQIALIHGRVDAATRDARMEDFRAGRLRLLVATTVIEVGVDVQDATLIIIEHAERFGLSQLHQLRGRVGRGEAPGTCLLLYGPELSQVGRQRLEVMRQSQDGFFIAQKDLELRGGGELAGARQSGENTFRMGDVLLHTSLLELAHTSAKELLERDPELASPMGVRARTLLHLVDKAQTSSYLKAA